jgi:hypothetical protein
MGLKGYRLWTMGQLDSTCRVPPGWWRNFRRRTFLLFFLLLVRLSDVVHLEQDLGAAPGLQAVLQRFLV